MILLGQNLSIEYIWIDLGRFCRAAPVVKPKNLKKTLTRLWSYFGEERKVLTFLFLLVILASVIGLTIPYLIGRIIDIIDPTLGEFKLNLLTIMVSVLVI
jgi:ATP-binding cassette, subfamily B, multidrug efflux pump